MRGVVPFRNNKRERLQSRQPPQGYTREPSQHVRDGHVDPYMVTNLVRDGHTGIGSTYVAPGVSRQHILHVRGVYIPSFFVNLGLMWSTDNHMR